MPKRDYYELLGIDKSASADEIKKAFRKLAIQYHPDKEGGDEAKFKEINEAYEVLKDSSKRQRYDQFGHAGVGGAAGGGGGDPFGGFGGAGQSAHFDFGDLGLGDIFGSFFGGGASGRHSQTRGADVETSITLTFEESVFGVEKEIKLHLQDNCSHCKGETVEPGYELKTCETCKGSGQTGRVINTILGQIQQAVTCPTCRGRGRVPEKECTVCKGKGVERREQKFTLKVPQGVDDGAVIRLRERGEAIAQGHKGDLYVHLRVKPHKKFTREGDLILSDEHISMVEATLGTEIEVETIDGPLTMKIPAGTQSGTDFKLSSHGIPHMQGSTRGAQIVTIHVDIPTKLTKKQKELLQEFAAGSKDKKHFWG